MFLLLYLSFFLFFHSVDVKIISAFNRSKGYGFITMGSASDAEKAVADLKGFEFDGRSINVERATPQEPHSEDAPRRSRGTRGRGRGGRGGSARRNTPKHDGPLSKTVIYVGNLPYKASDEDLLTIFSTYNVVKAHVVSRPTGGSKGYGFVTLASEADQTRALEELKNVECDDRQLHIKAAHSEEAYDERQKKEGEAEAEVPEA